MNNEIKGFNMTIQNTWMPAVVAGTIAGAYSVKQILSGSVSGLLKGAAAGALAAVYLHKDPKYAGIPVAIGTAASGWNDLARLKMKTGLCKIFLGAAVGVGSSAVIDGQPIGKMNLETAAAQSAGVAVAGLVQATVEGTWQYIKPVLVGVYECLTGLSSCCDRLSNDAARKREHQPQCSTVQYC